MLIPSRKYAVLSAVLCGALTLAACGSGSAPAADLTDNSPAAGRNVASSVATFPGTPAGAATYAPWPSALHDARHSGSSPNAGPTDGRIRWRRKLEGGVTPGPVIGRDGTIYASSNAGILHAIDPANGNDRWTYDSHDSQNGADLSVSPLVLPNGEILFPTPGSCIVALSPTGRELWSQQLPGRPTSPVTADGKRVYVGDQNGNVTALDVAPGSGSTHDVAWTVSTGAMSYASVVTNGSGAVYTTSGESLVAIADHGTSASVAWHADPHDGQVEVSPGLAPNGTVLLGTDGNNEWAYAPDGTALWHSPSVITYSSPSVTTTGLAFVGDNNGQVHVWDVTNGTEEARYQAKITNIWSSTVVDRNYRVYYAGQNGHVYAVSPAGVVLFDVNLGAGVDSYPALTADGALIVGATNGTLAAID